jgi:hypothetical protein
MPELKTQASKMPTRKMGAVIIAAFLVEGGLGAAEQVLPGIRAAIPASEWIATIAMILSGYFVKDRV